MTKKLIEFTKKIHQQYSPLDNMEGCFLGKQNPERLGKIIESHADQLSADELQRLRDEFFGWGPVTALFARNDLNEIMINGQNHIYYENPEGVTRHHDIFYSELTFRNFVQRLSLTCQTQVSFEKPHGNGHFEDFRVHIATPPISEKTLITLRRHQRDTLPLASYLNDNIINHQQLSYIKHLIASQSNFLIVGNTGSGKTTMLNSLLQMVPDFERVLVVEDTCEIKLPNTLSVRLLTRDKISEAYPAIDQQELVRQALRMRPDRIVMGEVRSVEAKDLLQALATGHRGSMGTLHADSPKQALYRLEMLIQMGAPQWEIQAIRRLIQLSLDHLILIQKREGKRQIEGIYQLASLEDFGFLVNKKC